MYVHINNIGRGNYENISKSFQMTKVFKNKSIVGS